MPSLLRRDIGDRPPNKLGRKALIRLRLNFPLISVKFKYSIGISVSASILHRVSEYNGENK